MIEFINNNAISLSIEQSMFVMILVLSDSVF